MRAAARDKSNYVLQEVAAEAVKEAKEALALRKGAEKMDSREIKEVLKEVESGKVDVSDEVFVPPELRKRKPIPEDEVEGNPYNCCKYFLTL